MTSTTPIEPVVIVGGLDIGNGYCKASFFGASIKDGKRENFDIPSVVRKQLTNGPRQTISDRNAGEYLANDFYNHLDASVQAEGADSNGRLLFGTGGIASNGHDVTQFDIRGPLAKAEQPLYVQLVDGLFAAKAVKDFFQIHGALPDNAEIVAEVYAGLALPIDEFMEHRHSFADVFLGRGDKAASHVVTVYNFDKPINVRLVYEVVSVEPEGGAAQYAINALKDNVIEAMLPEQADDKPVIDVAVIRKSFNTVGIDVGEGTVNFPVFTAEGVGEGRTSAFNPNASLTFTQGYGTVLENAIDILAQDKNPNHRFDSRKQLAEFMLNVDQGDQTLSMHRPKLRAAKEALERAASSFVDSVVAKYREAASAASLVDVVYVYGGGSGPEWIREPLAAGLAKAETEIPVLYLDATYSRNLNRAGLFTSAKNALKAVTGE